MREKLMLYLKSGITLILIKTNEVARAVSVVKAIVADWNNDLKNTNANEYLKTHGYAVGEWTINTGWVLEGKTASKTWTQDMGGRAVLSQAIKWPMSDDKEVRPGVYLLWNFHNVWGDFNFQASIMQDIINVAAERKPYRHLILVGDPEEIPADIANLISVVDFALPTSTEIKANIAKFLPLLVNQPTESHISSVADAAAGMTLYEVENIVRAAIVSTQGRDIPVKLIHDEKAQTVKRNGFLDYTDNPYAMGDVGGLGNLKEWADLVAEIFHNRDKARAYGLTFPRGTLITGITGTGKSLAAHAIAHAMGVALYRADIGRIMAGVVGSTERNTRMFFSTIDVLAPCVVLLDEMEKMFAGYEGRQDAGVMARVVEKFLTYLQYKNNLAFFVATANQITLPPELIRKGRFDTVWFVDLPHTTEREEIFRIHLERRRPGQLKKYNIKTLAKKSLGYTGAEIEGLIEEAMADAFKKGREFTTDDILATFDRNPSITKTKEQEITALRKWAKDKARIANVPEKDGANPAWWDSIDEDEKKGMVV